MLKVKNQKSNIRKAMSVGRQGFSMMEVVISASILIIMIAGIFLALGKSIMHSKDSRDYVIASELAQEGIELARNIRDNNWANDRPTFDGLSKPNYYCRIDYNTPNMDCGITDDTLYVLSYVNGFYEYDTNPLNKTKFTRRIVMPNSGGPNTIIRSIVSWDGRIRTPGEPCTTVNKCVEIEIELSSH